MERPDSRIEKARELAEAGRYGEVVRYLEGWQPADDQDSPALSLLLGTAAVQLGQPDQALQWVEHALLRSRTLGQTAIETRALNARGGIAFATGRIDEAADYFTQAMMAASRDGDHASVGRCSNNLGSVSYLRGRYAEALSAYTVAIAAFEQAALARGVAETRHNLAITYGEQGELNRALDEAQLAHADAQAAGDQALAASTLRGCAELHVLRHERNAAREEIERALKTHRELGDTVQEAEDLKIVASILAADGQLAEAESTLREVIERAEALERPQLRAEALRDLAYLLERTGRHPEARAAARTARDLFTRLGAENELRKLARHDWHGDFAAELRGSLEPLHEAQRLADAGRYAQLLAYLDRRPQEQLERSPTLALLYGIAHSRLGRLDSGQQWVMIALARARARGDRVLEVRALNVCGAIALERGGIHEATHFLTAAREEAMHEGDLATVGRCSNNLGIVANMQGNYGSAIGEYTMAIAAYDRARFPKGAAESRHNLGLTFRDQGDLTAAMEAAEQAYLDAQWVGDQSLIAQALAGRAEIHVAQREPELALRDVERALEIHRDLGDPVREAEDLRILAGAMASGGQTAEAQRILRDVIDRATKHCRPLLAAAAQRDLAILLHSAGDDAAARAVAEPASATFRRLGAKVDADILDSMLAGSTA